MLHQVNQTKFTMNIDEDNTVMPVNEDNTVMPVNEVNHLLLNPRVIWYSNRCDGCGKPNPKYFNVEWQLYVCGADSCKPYDIAMAIAYHAMTGE